MSYDGLVNIINFYVKHKVPNTKNPNIKTNLEGQSKIHQWGTLCSCTLNHPINNLTPNLNL